MILQTDACVCGGITEFRRIAATASSFGVTVCPHWFHDLHAHLVASTPNARYVEYFPDDQVLNFRRLINKQVTVENGEIVLPREPGLGFGWDNAAIERYATGPWRESKKAKNVVDLHEIQGVPGVQRY
jgi:L-alanine-DL-glutamate epimerase-like enolase superfamily enzyme